MTDLDTTASPNRAAVTCGCGCTFTITPGMRVHLINGIAYTQGCVSELVLVDEHGPLLLDLQRLSA